MADLANYLVPIAQYAVAVTGVLVLAGGLVGFFKAGSKVSLISGGVSAVLLGAAFGLSFVHAKAGLVAALLLSMALQVVFAIRFKKTGKFMPSGLLLIILANAEILIILGLLKLFEVM